MTVAIANRIRKIEFQISKKNRAIAHLEQAIAEFERLLTILESEIKAAEDRNRIHDPKHFAYSMYARATGARRENVIQSLTKFRGELKDHKATVSEDMDEFISLQRQFRASVLSG